MAGDPGRDGEQPEPEGLRFREGQFSIEGEVPQPRCQSDGERRQLQPVKRPGSDGDSRYLIPTS